MQVNYPSIGEILVHIWFATSVFVVIVSTFVLWFWLRRQGVKLVYGLSGIPGYMERAYLEWCRNQGKRPNMRIIRFRAVSLINVIIAGIVFILLTGK